MPKGRNIILVDDILTTKATVSECCQVLLDGGVSAVKAVTLSRVKSAVQGKKSLYLNTRQIWHAQQAHKYLPC
jgi:phosphoribosylpyrophosphate synthetase